MSYRPTPVFVNSAVLESAGKTITVAGVSLAQYETLVAVLAWNSDTVTSVTSVKWGTNTTSTAGEPTAANTNARVRIYRYRKASSGSSSLDVVATFPSAGDNVLGAVLQVYRVPNLHPAYSYTVDRSDAGSGSGTGVTYWIESTRATSEVMFAAAATAGHASDTAGSWSDSNWSAGHRDGTSIATDPITLAVGMHEVFSSEAAYNLYYTGMTSREYAYLNAAYIGKVVAWDAYPAWASASATNFDTRYPYTLEYECGAYGTNDLALIVWVGVKDRIGGRISTTQPVTYNGVALTRADDESGWWYLHDPPIGTHDLVIYFEDMVYPADCTVSVFVTECTGVAPTCLTPTYQTGASDWAYANGALNRSGWWFDAVALFGQDYADPTPQASSQNQLVIGGGGSDADNWLEVSISGMPGTSTALGLCETSLNPARPWTDEVVLVNPVLGAFQVALAATASAGAALTRAVSYFRTLDASATAQAALSRLATYARALPAQAVGAASLLTLATYLRALQASANASAALGIQAAYSRTIAATEAASANLSCAATYSRALAAGATGTAVLTRAATYLRALGAQASAAATLDRLVAYARALGAQASGQAGLAETATFARALAAEARSIATLVRLTHFCIALESTATGAASLARMASYARRLAATAQGQGALARAASYRRTLAAGASGVADLLALFISGVAGAVYFVRLAAVAAGRAGLSRAVTYRRSLAASARARARLTMTLWAVHVGRRAADLGAYWRKTIYWRTGIDLGYLPRDLKRPKEDR